MFPIRQRPVCTDNSSTSPNICVSQFVLLTFPALSYPLEERKCSFSLKMTTFRLLAVVIVALLSTAFAADVFIGVPGHLTTDPQVNFIFGDYMRGFSAAIAEINANGGIHGGAHQLRFEIVNMLNSVELNRIITDRKYLMLAGWIEWLDIHTQYAPLVAANNLTAIDTITYDTNFFDWRPNFMTLQVSKRMDLYAQLSHVVGSRQFRRISVVRTIYPLEPGLDSLGTDDEREVIAALARLGMEIHSTFIMVNGSTQTQFLPGLINFLGTKPQAVVFLGFSGSAHGNSLGGMLSFPNLYPDGITVIGSNVFEVVAQLTYQTLGIAPSSRLTVHSTSSTRSPTGSSTTAQRYRQRVFPPSGYSMMGYSAGRFIASLLEMTPVLTRERLFERLYSSTIIKVDENAYGLLSKECSADVDVNPLCRCNFATRKITINELASNLATFANPDDGFQIPVTKCQPDVDDIRRPVLLASLRPEGSSFSFTPQIARSTASLFWTHRPSFRTVHYGVNDSLVVAHNKLLDARFVTGWIGVTAIHPSDLPTFSTAGYFAAYFDPQFSTVTANPEGRWDIINLLPSLEQEVHAIISYLESIGAAADLTVLYESVLVHPSALKAFDDSSFTFMAPSPVKVPFSGPLTTSVVSAYTRDVYLFPLGTASASEVITLLDHLVASSSVRLILRYQTLAQFYSTIMAHPGITTIASRIIVATNLPNWGTSNTANQTEALKQYYASLGLGETPSPSGLQAFVLGLAVKNILQRLSGAVTGERFLSQWYEASLISVDSTLSFGPFSNTTCSGDDDTCQCNLGPRSVNVYSMADVFGGVGALRHHEAFTRCGVTHRVEPSSSLPVYIIILICILAVAVALIILLLVWTSMKGGDVRDTKCAPKDSSAPFCVAFTDIQSSTMLWSRIPEEMGAALDQHHAIIRNQIARHKCYEVKTIGDAFMIAGDNPKAMQQLAEDVQKALFEEQWDPKIDSVYKEAEREKYDLEGTPCTSANLSDEEYTK